MQPLLLPALALLSVSVSGGRPPVSPGELLRSRLGSTVLASAAVSAVVAAAAGDRESRASEALRRGLFSRHIPEGARVLEIGFGDGANLALYPHVRFSLLGQDPREVPTKVPVEASLVFEGLVRGVAEELPFPDEAFDAVVATLVLCSVADPGRCLSEVRRVLRPGGSFVFVEHVLGEQSSLLRLQHLALSPLQEVLADGCHLNRATDELLRGAVPGLFRRLAELSYQRFDSQWPISRQIFGALVK